MRTGINWIFSMQLAFELADQGYMEVVAVYIKGPAGMAGPWL
ncbi:hypothetical protein [Psychrobacillus psychrodurans]|nr:hypothetical protein [Psychrobacillus psychrodurans]